MPAITVRCPSCPLTATLYVVPSVPTGVTVATSVPEAVPPSVTSLLSKLRPTR